MNQCLNMRHGLEIWADKNPALAKLVRRLLFMTMWVLFFVWMFWWWAQDTIWFGTKVQRDVLIPKLDTGLLDGWEAKYIFLTGTLLLIYVLASFYIQIPEPKPTSAQIARRRGPPLWYEKIMGSVLVPRSFVGTLTFGEVFWALVFLAFLCWKTVKGMERAEKRYNGLKVKRPRYLVVWGYRGVLKHEIGLWHSADASNVAGEISFIFGIVLWAASQEFFRRRFYDWFYNIHMICFFGFSLFAFYHINEMLIMYSLPSLLLWGCDRFVRMVQRSQRVAVIATKEQPDGTVQVEVLKRRDMYYWPLQHIYVNQPLLSIFGWHPFSVESNPRDGARSLIFHIKPLGDWSRSVCQPSSKVDNGNPTARSPSSMCPLKFLRCEGLHGHTSNFFLRYPVLLLFAGGSGIVPYIPVIKEVLNRCMEAEDDTESLPEEIFLIWSVKHGSELVYLQDISLDTISSNAKLKLTVAAYVSRETEETSTLLQAKQTLAEGSTVNINNDSLKMFGALADPINKRSWWQEPFLLLMVYAGHLFMTGLLVAAIIEPVDHPRYKKFPYWQRSNVYLAALVLSVFIFGGLALLICHIVNTYYNRLYEGDDAAKDGRDDVGGWSLLARADASSKYLNGFARNDVLSMTKIVYGKRPPIHEIFQSVNDSHHGLRVCTMASGPQSMNDDVAAGCQKYNGGLSKLNDSDSCYFSYHSITYSL